jgi:hypothetical protein
MSKIKLRRLQELEVHCHPGTKVGQYVPFYFCPRSVMLYVLYQGNHPELDYRGGQEPIIHLVADLRTVVAWATQNRVPWAFSRSNAGAYLAEFRSSLEDLKDSNWAAIAATDFRDAGVKEAKQAGFLANISFPLCLIESVGVMTPARRQAVASELAAAGCRFPVGVCRDWYF